MGIPSYFAHIVRQHRKIIKPFQLDNPKIDNLYLDCNSFIYEAHLTQSQEVAKKQQQQANRNGTSFSISKDAYEKNLINSVCAKLRLYINQLQPRQRVFIAFDGVAPVAKLNQQRNRRYMTAFQASLNDNETNKHLFKWNTSAITPGTIFMTKLSEALQTNFNKPAEFGLSHIIVSSANEAGEGEHKIYEYIRNDAMYHKNTCTVIYGLDADLIMLTLNHLHISPNMYLFRETPEFIKALDNTLNPNETYLLDIPLFAETIIREMTAGTPALVTSPGPALSIQDDVLFDYIFLCFFLGNDFLPHFPALNIRTSGIDRLINAYKYVFHGQQGQQGQQGQGERLTLTKNREIVWKNVRLFIAHLAANELPFLQEEYKHREKLSKRLEYQPPIPKKGEDENLMLPLKERAGEIYINPGETGWEARYYNVLFKIKINDERRAEISTNYLEGLEWTMKYYSTGCADWRWTYNYYYPPLLTDLIKHVPYFEKTLVPFQPKNPLQPLVQLCYVLPPSSMDILPPLLQKGVLAEFPEWYVGNYFFLWSFCKFFWEAHVDLPEIDIQKLELFVHKV